MFSISVNAFGKPITDIQDLLHKKDFPALKTYVDSKGEFPILHWKILREITKDNYEGVINIDEIKDVDSNGSNVDNYTIRILSTSTEIFYYEIIKWTSIGAPQILNSFKNPEKFLEFKNGFAEMYHTSLIEKELFETDIVYGSSCGIVGSPTEYQQKLDSLIKEKNIPTILSWLKSPNAEKQLYAIQGLQRLERKGFTLDKKDKNLIKVIGQKEGEVNTCSGCLFYTSPISKIVESLNSQHSKIVTKKKIFLGALLGVILLSVLLSVLYNRRKRQLINLKPGQ